MDEMLLLRTLAGLQADQQLPNNPAELRKALTTSAGFLGIQLIEQAKLLLPRFAGLRNRLAVTSDPRGAATSQWRMQLGYGAFNFASAFGVANGANGADTIESATTIAADYKTMSIKGGVQWEAIRQAAGWDNAMTIDTKMALSLLLILEELEVLYANEAAITMTTISGNSATLATAGTFAVGTWTVIVTALTGIGTKANASSNSAVGESANSNALGVVVATSAKDFLDISWPAVPGALGYKVYCNSAVGGGAGATTLVLPGQMRYTTGNLTALGTAISVPTGQTYITVNHVQIAAVPTAGTPPPGVDGTANANVFEGIHSWCTKGTLYGQALPTRLTVDMAGLPLTTQSTGILEIDNVLQALWSQFHISPTLIVTSPNGVVSMANRIAAAGSNSQIRLDVYQERNRVIGGLYIGGYVNKFAASMIGSQATVDVWAHPYMPDGTLDILCEDIPPETYPFSGIGKTFELDVATPYTYLPLGRTDRSFPYDVFYNETMRCYHPVAQVAIVGVRMDS